MQEDSGSSDPGIRLRIVIDDRDSELLDDLMHLSPRGRADRLRFLATVGLALMQGRFQPHVTVLNKPILEVSLSGQAVAEATVKEKTTPAPQTAGKALRDVFRGSLDT